MHVVVPYGTKQFHDRLGGDEEQGLLAFVFRVDEHASQTIVIGRRVEGEDEAV